MSPSGELRVAARMPLREFEISLELAVEPGERLALAGPSGAGKTTLLRIVAGLARPATGRVRIGEEDWLDTASGREVPAEHRRCGVVFQDYALFPTLSAWRNVAYGMNGQRRQRQRAEELLDRFGIAALADARPASLSAARRAALRARPRHAQGGPASVEQLPRRAADPRPPRHPLRRGGVAPRRPDRDDRARPRGQRRSASARCRSSRSLTLKSRRPGSPKRASSSSPSRRGSRASTVRVSGSSRASAASSCGSRLGS